MSTSPGSSRHPHREAPAPHGAALRGGRFAVVGSPIGHSLSPAMHRAAYRELGITDAVYDAFDVPEGDLIAFLTDGSGAQLDGLSVTMPGKPEARALAADTDRATALLGIANTLLHRPDGTWRAENHDVHGIRAALEARGCTVPRTGGILGSGATALSALLALVEAGAQQVRISARRPEALDIHQQLARTLGVDLEVVPWERAAEVLQADAVVSALALPGSEALAAAWAGEELPAPGVFLEVLYAPDPPPLAALLGERGVVLASGLEMLAHQADMQVRAMTGAAAAPVEAMLAAARAAIAAR